MTRYVLAPDAASDLIEIFRHLSKEVGDEVAYRVERAIRENIELLATNPGVGHYRGDLCDEPVKFFPVWSWLLVYRPDSKPLQVISILHASRDVADILRGRTE